MSFPKSLQESVDSTKVEYRRLGKSGLKVSVPILGAMSIGNPAWGAWILDADKSLLLLKAAYDRGVNTWDTANVYSNGESEIVIGDALKKYDIPRHKVVIFTKCSGAVGEDPGLRTHAYKAGINISKDYVNQFGLSRGAIFAQVNASLKRLQTDYIDLLQIHRFDKNTPIEETMEALHDLVKSGKVRYIGASSMWTYQFVMMQYTAEKHGWTKFISMQNNYNLLYREEEREMNKFCTETGVGLVPYAPLSRGSLARPLAEYGKTFRSGQSDGNPRFKSGHTEQETAIITRVEEIAKSKGWSMSDVSLAWINKRVTSPIIGFSSVERIDEALTSKGKILTDEEEKYLEELYNPLAVVGNN